MQVPWLERYNYAQEALEKLTSLEERMKNQSLRKNQKWELAYWTYEFRSEDAAIPILEEILTDDVNHLSANYLLGQILLRQDNLRGVKYIEKAISQDSNIVVEGCSLMYAFFKKQGNLKLAHSYQERIYQYYQ
jgi:lipopolysaccharide biosynthesis regulator YciM